MGTTVGVMMTTISCESTLSSRLLKSQPRMGMRPRSGTSRWVLVSVSVKTPPMTSRSENEVIVREGERLVIGGVLTDTDTKTQREVPLLGRIPILGWLFKSRELSVDSQEMVVIITPTVVPIQRAR